MRMRKRLLRGEEVARETHAGYRIRRLAPNALLIRIAFRVKGYSTAKNHPDARCANHFPHARPRIASTTCCGFKCRMYRSVVARLECPNCC